MDAELVRKQHRNNDDNDCFGRPFRRQSSLAAINYLI